MLRAYIATIEVHGVLMFSTEQRPALSKEGGSVIVTGTYIHNYPLMYAMAGKSAEAYAVIPSLHFLSYPDLKKSPFTSKIAREPLKYTTIDAMLRKFLGGNGVYVFPAVPKRITIKKFFMAALGAGYAEFRGALKTVYPRLTRYIAIIPPSRFETVVLSTNRALPRELYLRIGIKRAGLLKMSLTPAEITAKEDDYAWTSIAVNLYDLGLFGYVPVEVVKVLETRSKPEGRRLASIVGYVKTKELYMIKGRGTEHHIPIPATFRKSLEV